MNVATEKQFYKSLGVTNRGASFTVDLDCYTLGYIYATGKMKKIPFKSAITKSFALGYLDKSSGKKFRFKIDNERAHLASVMERTVNEIGEYEAMAPAQKFLYFAAISLTVFFLWFLNKARKQVGEK